MQVLRIEAAIKCFFRCYLDLKLFRCTRQNHKWSLHRLLWQIIISGQNFKSASFDKWLYQRKTSSSWGSTKIFFGKLLLCKRDRFWMDKKTIL